MDPLEILWSAYHSDYGVEVEVKGNFQMALQKLYKARRSDPDLECVSIHRSADNPTTHLWLCVNHFIKRGTDPDAVRPLDSVDEELHRMLAGDEDAG